MSQKSDTGHTHPVKELTGLDTEILNVISSNTSLVTQPQLIDLSAKKSNIGHGHTISEIVGLTTELTGVYKKPPTGIPVTDLSTSLITTIGIVPDLSTTVSTLKTDVATIKLNLQGTGSTGITYGYTKPITGIPITDLDADINTTLHNATSSFSDVILLKSDVLKKSDIIHTHLVNDISNLSVTLDKLYQKPTLGIPITHLDTTICSILDSAANTAMVIPTIETKIANLSSTKANTLHIHTVADITELDLMLVAKANVGHSHTIDSISGLRAELSTQYKKPDNGIPLTDLDQTIALSISGLESKFSTLNSDITAFDAKKANVVHVHSIENVTGLADIITTTQQSIAEKYVKPNIGIPKSDLAPDIQTILTSSESDHTAVAAIQTSLLTKADITHTHSVATSTIPGLMSGADRDKLDSIYMGATRNSTDVALRDRTTHTGFQDISTISGLADILDVKYIKPILGIPKSDLTNELQKTLGYADTIPEIKMGLEMLGANLINENILWDGITTYSDFDWSSITEGKSASNSRIVFDDKISKYGKSISVKNGDSFWVSCRVIPRGGNYCNFDVRFGCIGYDIDGNQTEVITITRPTSVTGVSKLEGNITVSNSITKTLVPCMIMDMPVGIWPTGTDKNGIYATDIFIGKKTISDNLIENKISSIISGKADTIHSHDIATNQTPGFLSSADKAKLDNLDSSVLRDRANHTGVQAISTITGLQTAIDAKYVKATTGIPKTEFDNSLQLLLQKLELAIPSKSMLALQNMIDANGAIVRFETTGGISTITQDQRGQLLWSTPSSSYISGSAANSELYIRMGGSDQNTQVTITSGNKVGIGIYPTPKASLHIRAGTASVNTAPLKIDQGVLLTNPEPGVIEYDGTSWYATTSNLTRKTVLTNKDSIAWIPSTNIDPMLNTAGTFGIQAANNDSIQLKYKGSDGAIRSASMPIFGREDAQAHMHGMILNGAASMRTVFGFPNSTFDVDSPPGFDGCFKFVGANNININTNVIRVDPGAVYELSAYVKADAALLNAYIGFVAYDGDMNEITGPHVRCATGTTTTLASPLAVGDTTVVLDSSANWNNTSLNQCVAIYGYKSSLGKVYSKSVEPYTRFVTGTTQWNVGAIVGNTITLNAPLPANMANPTTGANGIWPIGTVVGNSSSKYAVGYNYRLCDNYTVPTSWTRITKLVGGGIDMSGLEDYSYFQPGTQYIKIVVILANTAVPCKIAGLYFNRTSLPRSAVI